MIEQELISIEMLGDLRVSIAAGGSRGDFQNKCWALTWRMGERRIDHKVRPDVFKIYSVHVMPAYRGRGLMTDLLRKIIEQPQVLGSRVRWIYLEQVNFRFANHLQRELHFDADFGMVIDCWREATGQMEMRL